jgi:hypothetical protein
MFNQFCDFLMISTEATTAQTRTLTFSDSKSKSVDKAMLLDMHNHLLRQSRTLLADLDAERDLNLSLQDQIKELTKTIDTLNNSNRKQVITLGTLSQS